MSILLNDLSLLLDVAERGSFSQAAAARGWSQPQVSQRIAQLEGMLGTRLFQRHRRGAVPTPACQTYMESVRRALGELDGARLAIQGTPTLPEARIGCPPSLASLVYAPLIAALAETDIELICQVDHSPELMERVLSHRLKVAFVMNRPTITGIQLELLADSPVIGLATPDNPLASKAPVTLAALAQQPRLSPQWWGPDAESLTRQIRQHRDSMLPLHTNQPATTARELALLHGFVVIAPALAVLDDLLAGRLVQIPVSDLPAWRWEVMMAYRAGKRPDPARDRVVDAARNLGTRWRQALSTLN